MLLGGNLKMALSSISGSKWRSLLTMLGVIIGVLSVVTTVSLGEGVKQEIIGQINHLGPDLITIRPGKTVTRNSQGVITGMNLLSTLGGSTISEQDLQAVKQAPGIGVVAPFSLITSTPSVGEQQLNDGFVLATTETIPDILKQNVEFGTFFGAADSEKDVAVIGKRVAEELFQENVPIGKTVKIRDRNFIVRGVFEEFDSSPLTPGADYNAAIFIPYEVGKQISGGQVQMYQILVRPVDPAKTNELAQAVRTSLLKNHDGQDDFTILTQGDNLTAANSILNLLTRMIAGVAAISLIVGGIGIMNIMLVSVSERTSEIGIRKAVGATNRQIAGQFLIESSVLSLSGGIIAIFLSLIANYLIRLFTTLQPVITIPIMGLSVLVALVVGVFFGVTPAVKAARKDPIEALRKA